MTLFVHYRDCPIRANLLSYTTRVDVVCAQGWGAAGGDHMVLPYPTYLPMWIVLLLGITEMAIVHKWFHAKTMTLQYRNLHGQDYSYVAVYMCVDVRIASSLEHKDILDLII